MDPGRDTFCAGQAIRVSTARYGYLETLLWRSYARRSVHFTRTHSGAVAARPITCEKISIEIVVELVGRRRRWERPKETF